MSTGLIIAIVIVALLLIALFAWMASRNRGTKARQRELEQRRERMATEQREEAAERNRSAEMAEQKARMAQSEAQKERAEADMREQRAQMHEKGMADHELIDDSERDKFAGASPSMQDEPAPLRDDSGRTTGAGAGSTTADGSGTGATAAGATSADGRPMHEPDTEYERGREDEAAMREGRFGRGDDTARTDEPSTTRRDA